MQLTFFPRVPGIWVILLVVMVISYSAFVVEGIEYVPDKFKWFIYLTTKLEDFSPLKDLQVYLSMVLYNSRESTRTVSPPHPSPAGTAQANTTWERKKQFTPKISM